MTTHLSFFEEFLLHFNTLKNAAKGDPKRLSNFYKESQAIRDAVHTMGSFLFRTDFERRVFHDRSKHFSSVPKTFESAWDEYSRNWSDIVSSMLWVDPDEYAESLDLPERQAFQRMVQAYTAEKEAREAFEQIITADVRAGRMKDLTLAPDEHLIFSYQFGGVSVGKTAEQPERPRVHPDSINEFDPRYHDGAHMIDRAMSYLKSIEEKHEFANDIRRSTGAYDYLVETIGINIRDIFRRWDSVPITFMPTHISKRYSQGGKGSLYDLMDDAVRAYVCGAPAAAIAMCRAALEMVLKEHYGKGAWNNLVLGKIIVLASQKFDFVDQGRLKRLSGDANRILHDYRDRDRMSKQDERTILEFLKTVKFLIQRAPD